MTEVEQRAVELEAAAQRRRTDEMKEVFKAAITEWLDEKFAEFGKWTMRGLAAAGLAALAYMIFATHGWKMPP